jgi:hypothetical protein
MLALQPVALRVPQGSIESMMMQGAQKQELVVYFASFA